MIITDYYKLERLPEYLENKTPRYDCTASTRSYPMFQQMAAKSRVKRFFCYYNGVPDTFSDRARNQADRTITNTRNISSVFIPNVSKPLLGYGDVRGSRDAILFVFSADYSVMELFVARGYKFNQRSLYNHLVNGGLDTEIAQIRNRVNQ